MAQKRLPTRDFIEKYINYDPLTGSFKWNYRSDYPDNWNTKYANQEVCPKPGHLEYRKAPIEGKFYALHRLAWVLYHGSDPGELQVDHVNGDIYDNRIENLRLADLRSNCRNRKRRSVNNAGQPVQRKYRGVRAMASGNFQAMICHKGKVYSLGSFSNPEDANAARKCELIRLGDTFLNRAIGDCDVRS